MSDLLNAEQLAKRLGGISTDHVRKQCAAGVWPHIKIAKKYLFRESHYEDILRIQEHGPATTPSPAPAKPAPRRTSGPVSMDAYRN